MTEHKNEKSRGIAIDKISKEGSRQSEIWWAALFKRLIEQEEIEDYVYENCVEWEEDGQYLSHCMRLHPLCAALICAKREEARLLYEKGYRWRENGRQYTIEERNITSNEQKNFDNQENLVACIESAFVAAAYEREEWLCNLLREDLIPKLTMKTKFCLNDCLVRGCKTCCGIYGAEGIEQYRIQEKYLELLEEFLPEHYMEIMTSFQLEKYLSENENHPSESIILLKKWLIFAKDAYPTKQIVEKYQNMLAEAIRPDKDLFCPKEYQELLSLAGLDIEAELSEAGHGYPQEAPEEKLQ